MRYQLQNMAIALILVIASTIANVQAQDRGFNLIVVGDPQPQTEWQFATLENDIVPHIATIVEEYRSTGYPTAIILTGDLVWDTLEYMPRLKSLFESLGVPLYTVIGNHDHDRTIEGDKQRAVSRYEEVFGPRNQSFMLGETLFLTFDNIDYTSYSDYRIDVDRQQLRWLKRTIKKNPTVDHVAIVMHASAYNFRTDELNDYARRMLRHTEGLDVDFITGHRHLNATADIAPNIVEHSVAQVGGNLWFAPMCSDGTPHCVLTIEERDGEWTWQTRLLGEEREKQLSLVQNSADEGVVVRVVGWDDKWQLSWSENGVMMGVMEQVTMCDPEYLYYVENEANYDDVTMGHLRRKIVPYRHYYRCRRTAENSEIIIIATDRFGSQYSLAVE